MNKFKVKVEDYKLALENYIYDLNIKIKKEIDTLVKERKKPIFFGLLTYNQYQELQYYNELLDENKSWSIMENEFYVTMYREKIKEIKDKIKSLAVIKGSYFLADDETLQFIYKYKG